MFYTAKQNYLNKFKTRNVLNTRRWDYNCGGYALGCFSWYHPFGVVAPNYVDNCDEIDFENNKNIYLQHCVDQILFDFPQLKQIVKKDIELYKGKEIIAFRLAKDDFHFILRKADGQWFEKIGQMPISRVKKDFVFSQCWDWGNECEYNSEIAFFVKN